ncbi:hypothetical protein SDC9_86853 [bioreactor metagenome]|uniref:NAD-specific glutamate dehydrogenase n=1 Tax=bioreactor metagenome TaxID=1076179 RepID=A0A644ZNE0_9ZZZZ
MQRAAAALHHDLLVGLFGVFGDEVGDAVHQGVRQTLANRLRCLGRAAPLELLAVVLGRTLGAVGDLQQTLGRIGAAVEHHVLHAFAQLGLQVVIHTDHAGIDDAHVHACPDRVIEEHGVDGLAHGVVAAEGEAHVGDAARDLGTGQVLLDPACGLDEIDAVVVVLFDARSHGKNVGIEDDVFGRKTHLIHQHAVGTLADFDLALVGVGLALFVERHHHGRRTIAFDQLGLLLELLDTFLHRDRIDDAFALDAAQSGLDHVPLRRIHHHRHLGDVGLGGDQIQKAHHRGLAVQHGLVHVHVDDLRTVFHLLARDGQGFLVLLVEDHARKRLGAGDVGALAHVDEQRAFADEHGLQTRQPHGRNRGRGRWGGILRGGDGRHFFAHLYSKARIKITGERRCTKFSRPTPKRRCSKPDRRPADENIGRSRLLQRSLKRTAYFSFHSTPLPRLCNWAMRRTASRSFSRSPSLSSAQGTSDGCSLRSSSRSGP